VSSGKSTYSANAAKQYGYIICNDDSILNALHANQYTLYNKDLKILYKSVENQILASCLMLKLPVILDDAKNVSAKRRSRFVSWCHSFDVLIEAIVFPNQSPEVHAKRRFEHDSRGFTYERWLEIAQYHQSVYSEPTLEEGFDKVYNISYEDILNGRVF